MINTKMIKAVIPVAGFGTRFLPITKTIPKEMLPIVDKPIVQYVVEELVEAGIKDIIFVTSGYKKVLEDFFMPHYELEDRLEKAGKTEQLAQIKSLSALANFVFVRQKKMAGTGDAVLTAEPAIGDSPFLLFWGDDFFISQPSRAAQLVNAYEKYGETILGCIESTSPHDGALYGFAAGEEVEEGIIKVKEFIEKPGEGKAPSKYAVICSLQIPEVFHELKEAEKEIAGKRELYYVDGVNKILQTRPVYAVLLKNAKYYDCGSKLGYLKTNIEMGLKREDIKEDLEKFLKELL